MAYDVKGEDYAVFGEAFLSMLDKVFDGDLTAEVRDAWASAYDMIARLMQEASEGPFTSEAFFGTIIRSVVTSQYGVSLANKTEVTGRAPITHAIERRGEIIRLSSETAS